jgi:ubiquinone/menaquinone biosynthesis C-methylase UbiE
MDRRLLSAAYDRSAPGYDARFRELQRVKFRAAGPLLDAAAGVCLDAGGGTGLLVEWLREEKHPLLAARWLVLDLSLEMLKLARARTPLLIAADLSRPPLREASCALVVAFTSILDDPPRALRELARVLRPGGQLVVSFLAAEAPAEFPGLRLETGLAAGQDRIFALRKDRP